MGYVVNARLQPQRDQLLDVAVAVQHDHVDAGAVDLAVVGQLQRLALEPVRQGHLHGGDLEAAVVHDAAVIVVRAQALGPPALDRLVIRPHLVAEQAVGRLEVRDGAVALAAVHDRVS